MKPGSLLAERFRIEHEAAVGGMGAVYRAVDLDTGAPVAVKVMRRFGSEDGERFAREIALLEGLRHPGIVTYIGSGITQDGVRFLACEWIDGESLSQRLTREGLTSAETVQVARQVAAALAEAHRHDIVHRDVKPDNVLLAGCDLARLKIIDFGIARRTDDPGGITRTGVLIGTPGYMSPEQARGERTVDARSDVFSLGCVLYECLTGRPAFSGDHLMAVRAKVVFSEPPTIRELAPEVSEPLAGIVERMLAKEPEARPRDGREVARMLDAITDTGGTIRRRVRAPQAATRIVRSRTQADAGGLVCMVFVSTTLVGDATTDLRPEDADARAIRAAVAPFGARLEVLADGAVAITLDDRGDGPEEQAARAARCALAVRRLLPDAAIVLSGSRAADEPPASALDRAIDRGVRVLEDLAMRDLFGAAVPSAAPSPTGGVRVDDAIGELLDPNFRMSRAKGGYVLHGERTTAQS